MVLFGCDFNHVRVAPRGYDPFPAAEKADAKTGASGAAGGHLGSGEVGAISKVEGSRGFSWIVHFLGNFHVRLNDDYVGF